MVLPREPARRAAHRGAGEAAGRAGGAVRPVVETRETAILQEAGIYQYRHPLAGRDRLQGADVGIAGADQGRREGRQRGPGSDELDGQRVRQEGAKMVREFSKLMLRAYNNEADNAVRSMKPYTLESSVARLDKAGKRYPGSAAR